MTPAATHVYKHLQTHSHITAGEALLTYRIFDLAGRIQEVRKFLREDESGSIETVYTTDALGKRYCRYVLTPARGSECIETTEREARPFAPRTLRRGPATKPVIRAYA